MSKRIAMISFMNKTELDKVEKLMDNIQIKTCKVPYGIDDENRYDIDNLPYHFTIFATNKENQNKIIKIAQKIDIDKIKVKVNNVKIMNGRNESFVLYLAIEDNEEIKELQRIFFNEFPKEKYNPEKFTFHLTVHIDKDYDKVLELQNTINDNFKPFYLEFDRLALYDYPGDMIKEISFGD